MVAVVPVASIFVIIPLQLSVEYLVARKCHGWTYCPGGHLSGTSLGVTELLRERPHSFTNVL
ncbi:unnamed protein product [Staurois parvus]|uniref:Uncharacterized protein n=1 Tax=Staurois parvus TaxID=386267 RepID=A0ABN9FGF8_9NEOB|nr:unnamed protein product [Staurois parvus]